MLSASFPPVRSAHCQSGAHSCFSTVCDRYNFDHFIAFFSRLRNASSMFRLYAHSTQYSTGRGHEAVCYTNSSSYLRFCFISSRGGLFILYACRLSSAFALLPTLSAFCLMDVFDVCRTICMYSYMYGHGLVSDEFLTRTNTEPHTSRNLGLPI